MKLGTKRTEEIDMNGEDSPLYRQIQSMKSQFSSNGEARAAYVGELEKIASSHRMTIEQLVQTADDSDSISSAERRQILRLSNLISALRK
jgi:hypothetical protein